MPTLVVPSGTEASMGTATLSWLSPPSQSVLHLPHPRPWNTKIYSAYHVSWQKIRSRCLTWLRTTTSLISYQGSCVCTVKISSTFVFQSQEHVSRGQWQCFSFSPLSRVPQESRKVVKHYKLPAPSKRCSSQENTKCAPMGGQTYTSPRL